MEQARCEVCFTTPHNLNPYQNSIKCQDCKRTAHLFCYDPNASANFVCDACKYKYHGCCTLCGNGGLLKRFPNGFAHPVCLFFNQAIIVADYSHLNFASAQNLKPGKKLKCSFCQNASSGVLKCGSKKCPLSCHIYCALKSYQALQGKGWRVCLPTLDSQKSYKEVSENLLLRTLRTKCKFISSQLGIKKSLKTLQLPIMIYCQAHSLTIVDCNCREYNEQKLDWLYCDGCCRWVHWGCVKVSEKERQRIQASDEGYYCQQCKNWQKWVKYQDSEVPERLPKMHIYDFVYINKEVEDLGSNAPYKLIQLAERIPLLPGLVYGALFLKKELAKKLKQKINLPKLKQALESTENMPKVLFQHKEEFQMMQWMNAENFLGESQVFKLAHPLEESLDNDHIDEMLKALEIYESKFCVGLGNSQLKKSRGKKTSQSNSRQPKIVVKQQKSDRRTRSSSSKTAQQSFMKLEMPVPVPKMEAVNYQQINEYLQNLMERFNNSSFKVDLVDLYEELFKMLKKPQIVAVLSQQPKNMFIRGLLMQTPKHAATYASFIGRMEYALQQITVCKKEDRLKPSLKSYKNLERAVNRWKRLKAMAFSFSSEESIQIKQALLDEFNNRQVGGDLKQSLLQFNTQEPPLNENNQNQNHDQNRLLWTTDLKRIERELLIKQNEGLYCEEIYLLREVLQQLRSLKFNKQSQEEVLRQLKVLEREGKTMENLVYFYKQYIQLYQCTQLLVSSLKLPRQNQKACFFHLLSRQNVLEKLLDNQPYLDSVITFFSKIKPIRLNLFSRSVQQTIVSLFKQIVGYFSETVFTKEQQLLVVNYWSKLLKIALPSELDKVIRLDMTLTERYIFQKLAFQKPEEIARLKSKLQQDLPKYQQLKVPFRTKKVTTLLGWIRLYEHILQSATNPCLLLLQPQKDQPFKKIKLEEITAYDKALTTASFPEGKFRENIRQLANSARQMKSRFDKIMACCDWQFIYGKSQPNWQNKIESAEVMEFITHAKRIPVSLEVEILECQIILDRFNKNSELATKILLQVTNIQLFSISSQVLDVIRQLVNHFGASPIRCELSQQLFQILKNTQNPNKRNQKLESIYQGIASSPQQYFYEEVSQLIQIMETNYQGVLDKSKAVAYLKNTLAVIEECLSQFKDIFDNYRSQKMVVTQIQLKRLESLAKKYRKSSIQHRGITEVLEELGKYQYLARFWTHFEKTWTPAMHRNVEIMSQIKGKVDGLRLYFQNEKMQHLKKCLNDWLEKKEKA